MVVVLFLVLAAGGLVVIGPEHVGGGMVYITHDFRWIVCHLPF